VRTDDAAYFHPLAHHCQYCFYLTRREALHFSGKLTFGAGFTFTSVRVRNLRKVTTSLFYFSLTSGKADLSIEASRFVDNPPGSDSGAFSVEQDLPDGGLS
jgi:hypothetical protein